MVHKFLLQALITIQLEREYNTADTYMQLICLLITRVNRPDERERWGSVRVALAFDGRSCSSRSGCGSKLTSISRTVSPRTHAKTVGIHGTSERLSRLSLAFASHRFLDFQFCCYRGYEHAHLFRSNEPIRWDI